jgi:type I restriction enzyme S subunit
MGQSPSSTEYASNTDERPFLQGNGEFGDRYPIPRLFCDSATKVAPVGAILLSVRAPVGALNEADQAYGIGRGLCAVVPKSLRFDKRYAWYLFALTRTDLISRETGSTYGAVSVDEVGDMMLCLPAASEQHAIADFLDRETARLDTLVEKRRELIEKLKEKRTAFISRTVTRGLNPNVKLKPSSIEWLGEIPEHWDIKKLSWLFRYAKGPNAAMLTKEYVASNTGDFPVFSGQTEDEGLMGMIDTFEFDFTVPVVFVTTVGARAMTTRLVSGKFSLSQNCALIIPRSINLSVAYYNGVLRRLFDFERRSISLIMQPSLRFDDLNEFRVPRPPAPEQRAIAECLGSETAKLDKMIEKVEAAIEKLQEYCTALITAAVTGKIDVRNSASAVDSSHHTH